jgi:hypothetical protein
MKKNKFFFLLMLPAVMLVSVFISCSTDDPDPNAYDFNDEIATGTWKIDSVVGFYPMRYFVLNDKFNGGTLYLQKGGMYQLTNGDKSWTQTGSWKSGRWYVVLTANGGEPDTLQVMAPRNKDAANWRKHLDLYKVHRQPSKKGDGSIITDKQVHMYTTKQ